MKITLNWLKQYVDFNWSPAELAERLTMLGLEVEGVQKLGGAAHTPDEFLEIESIVPAAQTLALAVIRAAARME